MMKKRFPTLVKVTRPIPTGIYPRKRLFDLLDRIKNQPVIWVSGPPGCGKTTLVTSYVEPKEFPCLWYQIDPGDADPATFFYYLGLAAKKATPRKRKPLPYLTPEYLPGLPTFTLRYFENLYHRLNTPSFLVFDNYQEVPLKSPFHEVVRHGLSNIPEGIHVILISRSEPPPVLVHMQANNQMEVIGWQDLRLTLKESHDIVKLKSRRKFSSEAIGYLHAATEGWLAGLMLMLKTAEIEKIDPRGLGKVPAERIFDYFTGEIFDKTDTESQRFLLQTAFLPKMTVEMADALTGLDSARRILPSLNRNHCFTERRFRSRPVYEYHPLFREFLLLRAKETFTPENLWDLRCRAAMLLNEADQTEAAMTMLHDAGDWESMVQLILKHAPVMLAQGRNRSLEAWLSSLPKDMFESIPWLSYWMGACLMFLNPSSSREYFEQAFERFKSQEDTAGIFLAWSGIVNSIVHALEDYKSLDSWIEAFDTIIACFPDIPSKDIEARVASSMFLALTFRQPQHPEVEAWAERALSLAKGPETLNEKVQTLAYLIRHHVHTGNLEKAAFAWESLKQLPVTRDASHASRILEKLAEAIYFYNTGSFEKCKIAMSQGLELSRKTGVHMMDSMLIGMTVSSALDENNLSTAGTFLGQMDSFLDGHSPLDICFYHLLRAREALMKKNTQKAYYHAEFSYKLNRKQGIPSLWAFHQLLMAVVLSELGEYQKAAEHIEDALHTASKAKSTLFKSHALFIKAQSGLDQGNEGFGLELLRNALAYGKKHGHIHKFLDIPSKTAELCAKALEAGIEIDYVQDIIRKRNLIPDEPPVHLDNWPWAIRIFTLGRFEMVIHGNPFKFPKKAQKKPLDMLKVLISFGQGQWVGKARLSDMLWPEADGDRAHQSFDTTLHRLRQLLGHDKAISLREGKLTLDLRYCWVDSMAFERILEQAENASKKGDRNRAIPLLEQAVALYKGPFLGRGADEPWAISYNERLRSKFLRAIERLGMYLEEEGELNRAVECFHRAIEVDDIAEVFYQRLMVCLKQLGRRTDALAVYQRCKKTLAVGLGLEPTLETKAIKECLFDD